MTGEEALQFAYENSIDAVLTDVRMAAMNGLELIRKLSSVNSEMKFVILSGYDDFSYAQKAIQSGVFDYILKPVSFEQLSDTFSRLKELMDRERELLNLSFHAFNSGVYPSFYA
jgi:two-component system response regulator YesN